MSDPLPRSPHGATGFRLWSAANALRRAIDAALRPHGLTHAQCVVMLGVAHLSRGPRGARLTEIAALDGLDLNHASQVLSRLEARGYVARGRDPTDARARPLTLTDAGRAALADAIPDMDGAHDAFLRALAPDERAGLHDMLGRLG